MPAHWPDDCNISRIIPRSERKWGNGPWPKYKASAAGKVMATRPCQFTAPWPARAPPGRETARGAVQKTRRARPRRAAKMHRALPDQIDSSDRKVSARVQRAGACSDRKSLSTFSEHALVDGFENVAALANDLWLCHFDERHRS